ncbi:MAG: hypothetical protein IPM95_09210 [Sphingobacteriales bacterium]|jgi:hypothetical protein|nr:hypothetical protein [Sphingobacteriales bacterium]
MRNFYLVAFLTAFAFLTFAQPVPYNVNKKKFPLGEDYQKLLPLKIGTWKRFSFHDFLPGQERGSVYYQLEKKEIFVQFGKALNQANMAIEWSKLCEDAMDGRQYKVLQQNNTNVNTKFLLMEGKSGYYYAWTRNLYYFSIRTKVKADADDFMKSFPW